MKPLESYVFETCLASKEVNPLALFNTIIKKDGFPMHGPIHHFLVPAVFLTCYHNLKSTHARLEQDLAKALERAIIVPGAFCANFGACGAGIGIGIFVSLITNNTPYSTDSWSQTISVNAACQNAIAKNGGPRCCKRNSYLSIIEGIHFLNEEYEINFPMLPKIVCFKANENEQCRKDLCPFFLN